jgi:hypothetical protein
MREGIKDLDGKSEVQSDTQGTTIIVAVPLAEQVSRPDIEINPGQSYAQGEFCLRCNLEDHASESLGLGRAEQITSCI